MKEIKQICRQMHLEMIDDDKVIVLSKNKPRVNVDVCMPIDSASLFFKAIDRLQSNKVWLIVDDIKNNDNLINKLFRKREREAVLIAVDADIYKSTRIPCDIILTEELEHVS